VVKQAALCHCNRICHCKNFAIEQRYNHVATTVGSSADSASRFARLFAERRRSELVTNFARARHHSRRKGARQPNEFRQYTEQLSEQPVLS
jgi:hypothetical protein